MYGRFLNPRKALKYMRKSSAYTPLMSMANVLFGARRRTSKNNIEKIERFDPAWDDIWDRLMFNQFELYGVRDAEFLNYKLAQPNREYRTYVHRSNDAIDGYIIYRHASHRARDLDLVKVCDLVGTYEAKLDLVSLAMKFAYDVKAYGIVAIGANEDKKMYRKAGMYVARPYVIAMPAHITAKMHVTFFDSDLDNLW
jgi:hypothetical protein